MNARTESFSVGEVAAATGLSVHAIRYFEREGLLLRDIGRSGSRHRVFYAGDVEWLLLVNRFRNSGMPIAVIRRFAELVREGPGNEADRLALLREHERAVEVKIAALQDNLQVIRRKVAVYDKHVRDGTAAEVWDPRQSTPAFDGGTNTESGVG